MRKRSQSRELALQILYQADIKQIPVDEFISDFWKHLMDEQPLPNAVREYAQTLACKTFENLKKIDEVVEQYTENWEMDRMAYVDRNILRLSTYELLYQQDVPMKVVLNEAVELAKRFGEDDSSKFVNGILDKIAKTVCRK